MARVLREPTRLGLAAIRAAGWRAPLTALLGYVPLLGGGFAGGPLLLVGLVLHVVLLLALVRVLGAWRPEPLPPIPRVDEEGRRVAVPLRQGPPVTDADRSPFAAIRNAARLARPALVLTGLFLLAGLGASLVVVALSGGRLAEYGPVAQVATVLPVTALFTAFVVLATQRVGLEGDPRVLVAAAHSVRIARTAYGVLLLLSIAEPAVATAATLALPEDPPSSQLVYVATATVLAAAAVKVLVTAVANEVYLAGPRLDLPAEPAP